MKNIEEWKVYKFGKSFDESYQLLFSNYGEVKSCTKNNPEGRILKGSLREGYPIISFTQYKPIQKETQQFFLEKENLIKALRAENNELKKLIRKKDTNSRQIAKAQARIEELTIDIKKSVAKLSKQRKKDLKKRAEYYHILVHKAVAELFIPNDDPENKRFVIHKNFDKKNNQVDNLEWATREEVVKRSFESPNYIRHTINRPKKNPNDTAKLQQNEVVFIKRKLAKGEPMARLARRFGVSEMQIYRIKTGENWSDIKLSSSKNK